MNFDKILKEQEKFKEKTGKYFQVIKGKKKNPNEKGDFDMIDIDEYIEIHEHRCPNGEVGFTVYETNIDGYTKATGYGCGSNNYDWSKIEKINVS